MVATIFDLATIGQKIEKVEQSLYHSWDAGVPPSDYTADLRQEREGHIAQLLQIMEELSESDDQQP